VVSVNDRRRLLRRGWAYALLYLAIGAGPLVPRTWIGLAIVFALHQIFLAARITLRLAHLGATQGLLLAASELRAPAARARPPAPPGTRG
jgi:hypothetical protein